MQILEYGTSDRRSKRRLKITVICAIAAIAALWGPKYIDQLFEYLSDLRKLNYCLNFRLPENFVVYSDDPATMSQLSGRKDFKAHNFPWVFCNYQGEARLEEVIGPYDPSFPLFCGRVRTPDAGERLVVLLLQCSPINGGDKTERPMVFHDCVLKPSTTSMHGGFFDESLVLLVDCHDQVTIEAGQVSKSDPSVIVIPIHVNEKTYEFQMSVAGNHVRFCVDGVSIGGQGGVQYWHSERYRLREKAMK